MIQKAVFCNALVSSIKTGYSVLSGKCELTHHGQINLNKTITANAELSNLIRKDFSTIYCVQEPYLAKNGRIPGLPRGFQAYGTPHSRAMIIAPKSMPIMFCHELLKF